MEEIYNNKTASNFKEAQPKLFQQLSKDELPKVLKNFSQADLQKFDNIKMTLQKYVQQGGGTAVQQHLKGLGTGGHSR